MQNLRVDTRTRCGLVFLIDALQAVYLWTNLFMKIVLRVTFSVKIISHFAHLISQFSVKTALMF